jgi:hypothetical protein
MARESISVFVSSATASTGEERRATAAALADLTVDGFAFRAVLAESFAAEVGTPESACLTAVRACDLFLAVLGPRYSEPVAAECEAARAAATPCLIFVTQSALEPPQQGFVSRILDWRDGHFVQYFDSAEGLKYQIYRALHNLIATFLPFYARRLVRDLASLYLAPFDLAGFQIADLSPRVLAETLSGGETPDGKPAIRWVSPEDALASHKQWLLIGPGGAGKTTLLGVLAHAAAQRALDASAQAANRDRPIPVLLKSSPHGHDLLGQIAQEFTARGLRCDPRIVKSWLEQGALVLLIDEFDTSPAPHLLARTLADLMGQNPNCRFVLASRPNAAALRSLRCPVLTLEPLDDAGMKRLFVAHLGEEGQALFGELAALRGLDAFRQPLMAWFAALAYRGGPQTVPLSRGALYRRVLEGSYLENWEAARGGEAPNAAKETLLECLALLGHHLVRRGAQSLGQAEAARLCDELLRRRDSTVRGAALLAVLAERRLLTQREERVSFWHPTFRDYFAAVWLERHFGRVAIVRRVVSERWFEVLEFLVGILPEDRARVALDALFSFAPLAIRANSVLISWSSAYLFLLVRCLIGASGNGDLRDRFVTMIGKRTGKLYLSRTSGEAAGVPVFIDYEAVLSQFYAYVGELRTPASFDFLRSEVPRRYALLGLLRSRHPATLAVILADFEAPDHDGIADSLAGVVLLEFPPDRLLGEVQGLFARVDSGVKQRVLRAFSAAPGQRRSTATVPRDEAWVDYFAGLTLHDDEDVGSSARSLLQTIGGGRIPPRAEAIYLDALAGAPPEVRVRSLNQLWYCNSEVSKAALERALDDEEPWVRGVALSGLRIRDGSRFREHVAHVVSACLAEEDRQRVDAFREKLLGLGVEPTKAGETAVLGVALGRLRLNLMRRHAATALGHLGTPEAALLLAFALRQDPAPMVRKEALFWLDKILGADAEPFVLAALHDQDAGVRVGTLRVLRQRPDEVSEKVRERIQQLLEDPDEEVRSTARSMLSYGALSRPATPPSIPLRQVVTAAGPSNRGTRRGRHSSNCCPRR